MTILVTGAAGFIGMYVASALLVRGERVIGIDNMNAYYDPALKQARLAEIEGHNGFSFAQLDFADRGAVLELINRNPDIDRVVHLGAQAGVRYSIEQPFDYLHANLTGQLVMMEACRAMLDRAAGCKSFVYASSSSVYGANREMPFSLDQQTDHPMSFYGATKKSCEVMAHSYAHLYRIPTTGLRFFTVYGPWGRPDMSPYIFTSRVLAGETIRVFNHGDMKRDFTYIDDITSGVIAALDRPPSVDGADGNADAGAPPVRLYNLGNHKSVNLMDYIAVIEQACGKKAVIDMQPMQPGDVLETYADISESQRDLDFQPTTTIEVGIPKFVEWYRAYHNV
jgi:UDP-glucuronate 4-epimerase